ncbi:mannose-6-phosphate isomerase [Bacteroidia bacterium]|nr:mannose-6-phosphate isomerase [Bacteroidia bacterium]
MFVFKPILKPLIWGGSGICPFKGISPELSGIGESWEISHVEGNYSVVASGPLEGWDIDKLIRAYGPQLLGKQVMERFGTTFPLLIKFIDAADDLSVQVHPGDELAKQRHNSFGKTEMWYVVKASEGASLYSGFSQEIDAEEYVGRVAEGSLTDVLQRYEVKAGDSFYLPAGRVHAIGKGCFIAEIQQTSNITYRIYDYNRKGADGKERELHTGLAKDAIDFRAFNDYRTSYAPQKDMPVTLADNNYFTVRLLDMSRACTRDFRLLDSFVIYICLEGRCTLNDNKGNTLELTQGQTVLLPASTEYVTLLPAPETKLLEACSGENQLQITNYELRNK